MKSCLSHQNWAMICWDNSRHNLNEELRVKVVKNKSSKNFAWMQEPSKQGYLNSRKQQYSIGVVIDKRCSSGAGSFHFSQHTIFLYHSSPTFFLFKLMQGGEQAQSPFVISKSYFLCLLLFSQDVLAADLSNLVKSIVKTSTEKVVGIKSTIYLR